MSQKHINPQLKNILTENKDRLLSPDYIIRDIFVTNAKKDDNAHSLIGTVSRLVELQVWDREKISQMYVPSDKAVHTTSELSFDVFGWDYSKYIVDDLATVVIASLSAKDIVKIEGIENQEVFDLNLRKKMGKTKVNKDIYESIDNSEEHRKFFLYHNGITIICSNLDTTEEGIIKIKDYAIVNGCQSVSCLYDRKNKVTEDLRILTRIIEIKSNSDLIYKITYNSNNQNGIKVRDFRSNTATQVRLQREINQNYSNYFYQIKSGEKVSQDKICIDNQLAGRILLVFDLKEPWAVQGIKKIFEDSHARIFSRPEVTGERIVTLFKLYEEIQKDKHKIKPELFQGYQITGFMLLHLISQVLSQDEVGKRFCKKPESFILHKEKIFFQCIHEILGYLIIDLNSEFKEGGGEDFDFKKAYKSPKSISSLTNEVLKSYEKLVNRGRVESFSELWQSSS